MRDFRPFRIDGASEVSEQEVERNNDGCCRFFAQPPLDPAGRRAPSRVDRLSSAQRRRGNRRHIAEVPGLNVPGQRMATWRDWRIDQSLEASDKLLRADR
jgi:hypothetical protein